MTTAATIVATVATAAVSNGSVSSSATKASNASSSVDSNGPSKTSKPFDHQLKAARQQQGLAKDAPSTATPPPSALDGKSGQPTTDAHAKDKTQPDLAASALAGTMLALVSPPMKAVVALPAAASGKAGTAKTEITGTVTGSGVQASTLLQSGASNNPKAAVEVQPKTAGSPQALVDAVLPRKGSDSELSSNTAHAVGMPVATAPAAPPPMHVLQLPTPVGSPAFGHELAQQVTWLGGQDLKQATIRLHPEELGQLDVKVKVTHGQVDVVFSAQHPGAVTAVQQSLSQLGHLLAQHGLNLGHAEVGQHPRGDHPNRHGGASRGVSSIDADETPAMLLSSSPVAVGLLDAFA